ncbi:MAG: hypothetical protein JW841_18110 [Deltaproteobacteria bacterium]|nr:hypothetical protein [Deltaproteobacteria bacterium]
MSFCKTFVNDSIVIILPVRVSYAAEKTVIAQPNNIIVVDTGNSNELILIDYIRVVHNALANKLGKAVHLL